MLPIGERVGAQMTKSRKLWVVVCVSLLIGIIVTISEPDLQVLAGQVPGIPNAVLIGAVAVGVGIFLVVALLRILVSDPVERPAHRVLHRDLHLGGLCPQGFSGGGL